VKSVVKESVQGATLAFALTCVVSTLPPLRAEVPGVIRVQGTLEVKGNPHNASAYLKFAIDHRNLHGTGRVTGKRAKRGRNSPANDHQDKSNPKRSLGAALHSPQPTGAGRRLAGCGVARRSQPHRGAAPSSRLASGQAALPPKPQVIFEQTLNK